MILKINSLLSSQEIEQLRTLAQQATFVDGKISNPHKTTKNNQQIEVSSLAHQQSVRILSSALARNENFRDFAMPKRFAAPLLCKYGAGMAYGTHFDSSYISMPQQPPLRSDISATIFLSEPDSYDGGELVIHMEDQKIALKLPAGGIVVYPSTTIHEVAKVTRGERLVAITFIESQVADERQRHMIYSLGEVSALEGLTMKPENRDRLDLVKHNLIRMWSN